jgi:hypothetical protein
MECVANQHRLHDDGDVASSEEGRGEGGRREGRIRVGWVDGGWGGG